MKKISTEKAPQAIGPYSQAILADRFLFASGQIPVNPETGRWKNVMVLFMWIRIMKGAAL